MFNLNLFNFLFFFVILYKQNKKTKQNDVG